MNWQKILNNIYWFLVGFALMFGGWALGLNQLAQFVESKEKNDVQYWTEQCALLNAPHALLIDGEPYCYKATMGGSEQVLPYWKLLELMNEAPQPTEVPEGTDS